MLFPEQESENSILHEADAGDKERSTFSASTRKLQASAAPDGGPMPQTLCPPRLPPRRQPVGERRRGLPHRHAGAGAPAADAGGARRRRRPEHAGLRQRLPRLAARHGRPGRSGRPAKLSTEARHRRSCRRSTRSSPPPRCSARSGSSPTPSAPSMACSRMWYGKGPGVDRAGDALKHGNAYGSSPHGGVLVVAGDDHGCVSSSMPHQSDVAFRRWHMPVRAAGQRRRVPRVRPVRLGAVALLGHVGRLHGAVGDGGERRTVDLDRERARRRLAGGADVEARDRPSPPADGLHYRWPDLPSLQIEERLDAKLRRGARLRQGQPHRPPGDRRRRARRSASSPAARRTST